MPLPTIEKSTVEYVTPRPETAGAMNGADPWPRMWRGPSAPKLPGRLTDFGILWRLLDFHASEVR